MFVCINVYVHNYLDSKTLGSTAMAQFNSFGALNVWL